jgi:hypothetical protein
MNRKWSLTPAEEGLEYVVIEEAHGVDQDRRRSPNEDERVEAVELDISAATKRRESEAVPKDRPLRPLDP